MLKKIILDEILKEGAIPFARFMELALYHPEWGYYARATEQVRVGKEGDFFTSVSVGGLFGRLLAQRFARWWKQMDCPVPFTLVEAGALDGRLAGDIMTSLKNDSPLCWNATEYVIVEPLEKLLNCQRRNLAGHTKLRWVRSLMDLSTVTGILFGNELLDAFPVSIFEQVDHSHQLKTNEWWVNEQNGECSWKIIPCEENFRGEAPINYRGKFENTVHVCEWLRQASQILRTGKMLFLDYGWTDEEYFEISRPTGTIRGYQNHHPTSHLLKDPGQQDLTSHVRWTPIFETTNEAGWLVEEFIQQGRWLTGILAEQPWSLTPQEIRQFHVFTHPDIMGESFRVLVLGKSM